MLLFDISYIKLNTRGDIPCLQATMYYIDDFAKISDHFPNISEDPPKLVSEYLVKIFEAYRRLPMTFEDDPKMIRSLTKKF